MGQKVVTEEDAIKACQALHARGPSTVVSPHHHSVSRLALLNVICSSVRCKCYETVVGLLPSQIITSFHPEGVDDYLYVIASTTNEQVDDMPQKLRIKVARSKAYFTGTGL